MIKEFKQADLIFTYTRAQAIEDGVLIDVSDTAAEEGVLYPVAVTARVWAELIVPALVLRERFCQSEKGRLLDVFGMLRSAVIGRIKPVKRYRDGLNDVIHFQVPVQMLVQRQKVVKKKREVQLITLKAVCGPGDYMEPVITIMMPDED